MNIHSCRGYRDFHGYSHKYGYGMSMGTVINPNGLTGILWRFLNGCEVQWKSFKHGVNVIVDV